MKMPSVSMTHVVTILCGLPLAPCAVAAPAAAAWIRLLAPVGVGEVRAGAAIFTNRGYAFAEFPAEVDGLGFVKGGLEATSRVVVQRGGVLRALTAAPETGASHGQSKALLE